MDLGEAVAVSLAVALMEAPESVCSMTDEPVEAENDFTDDFEETEEDNGFDVEGVKLENNAGVLGENLGGRPARRSVSLMKAADPASGDTKKRKLDEAADHEVTEAAHHLIPGNGSLKKSTLFKGDYLRTEGMAKGNIGYDVNASANGVWLPGNYAIRPWSGKPSSFKTDYAFAVIDEYGRQFHDAHRDYNNFVLEVLNKIADKLNEQEAQACPDARDEGEDNPPLTFLVGRLKALSARMRTMLQRPVGNWRNNVFTSNYSRDYMDSR